MPNVEQLITQQRDRFASALEQDEGFFISRNPTSVAADGTVHFVCRDGAERTEDIHVELGESFPFEKPVVRLRNVAQGAPALHMMADGSLCLYDDFSGWSAGTTPKELVERIAEALRRGADNDWRDIDLQPDFHRYFPRTGIMVFGETWSPPANAKAGRFSACRSSDGTSFATQATHKLDPGGSRRAVEDRVFGLLNLDDLRPGPAVWFSLQLAPGPKLNARDFLVEVDRCVGEPTGFSSRILRAVYGDKATPGAVVVALGFPENVSTGQEWYFFAFTSDDRRVHWNNSDALSGISVTAFESAPADRASLLRRSKPDAAISSARVCIYGIGAIGSTISLQLAKVGIQSLLLVDRDVMRPTNAVRHAVSIRATGVPKQIALAALANSHNPYCDVETADDITYDLTTLRQQIMSAQLVIDSTANRSFSLLLCGIACELNIPYIEVASYRNGAIGRIRVTRPHIDACQLCYQAGYLEKGTYPAIKGDVDQFREVGCASPVAMSLTCDLDVVANICVQVSLEVLRGRPQSENHIVIVNEPDDGLPQFGRGLHYQRWAPIPGCALCGS